MKIETVAIVPTYNEADNVDELLRQLLVLPVNLGVIVVDDNSPDGTGQLADHWVTRSPERVTVLHRASKLGLGSAHIAGFKTALERSDVSRIITMDADFSHDPSFIPSLISLGRHKHVAIGSRYVPGGGSSHCTWQRVMLSRTANLVAKTVLGLKVGDATAGFRLYHRGVLEAIPLDCIFSNGYSFLIEMLYLCQRQGWQIGETPIIYEDRRRGQTKISSQEIHRALYTVLRLSVRRLRRQTPQRAPIPFAG